MEEHQLLCVVDPRLRDLLQQEVAGVFLPLYREFFEKYSQIRFSKKNQQTYLKHPPSKVERDLFKLYVEADIDVE